MFLVKKIPVLFSRVRSMRWVQKNGRLQLGVLMDDAAVTDLTLQHNGCETREELIRKVIRVLEEVWNHEVVIFIIQHSCAKTIGRKMRIKTRSKVFKTYPTLLPLTGFPKQKRHPLASFYCDQFVLRC
jgi:hypothetical protein